MNEHAIPKGILWRLARTFLIVLAMIYALKLIGQKLSFGDTANAIGLLVIMFLATLTDRTDFYNVGRTCWTLLAARTSSKRPSPSTATSR